MHEQSNLNPFFMTTEQVYHAPQFWKVIAESYTQND